MIFNKLKKRNINALLLLIAGLTFCEFNPCFAGPPDVHFLVNFKDNRAESNRVFDSERGVYLKREETSGLSEVFELLDVKFQNDRGSLLFTLSPAQGNEGIQERIIHFYSHDYAKFIKDYIENAIDSHELNVLNWEQYDPNEKIWVGRCSCCEKELEGNYESPSNFNFDDVFFVNLNSQEPISAYRVIYEATLKKEYSSILARKKMENVQLIVQDLPFRGRTKNGPSLSRYFSHRAKIGWPTIDLSHHYEVSADSFLESVVISKDDIVKGTEKYSLGRDKVFVSPEYYIQQTYKLRWQILIDDRRYQFLHEFLKTSKQSFSLILVPRESYYGDEEQYDSSFNLFVKNSETDEKLDVVAFIKKIERENELATGVYKSRLRQMKDWIKKKGVYGKGSTSLSVETQILNQS